jgi:hypothetical protein
VESKVTLSEAWDTTVRPRISVSVLSIGWESLAGQLLAVAALLGSSVLDSVGGESGGILTQLLPQSTLREGKVCRLER